MDSSGPVDEVIADSEGEMDEEEHTGNPISQVSAFTLTGQVHGNTTSSISAFIAGPFPFCKQNFTADNQLSDIDNFVGIASIADRAKTRQRNPKSNLTASSDGQLEKHGNILSDIIELTSEDNDDELSPRSSKAKSRPRPKPRLKVKDKLSDMRNDSLCVSGTTEIGTDKSADALPDPPPRPRPRPRPLAKRNKIGQESTAPPPLEIPGFLPSSSASAFNEPELPIATSPVRPHLHTSQLPPSDPPLPTLTTIHDEDDLPRIETLPNLDFDGPLSSPLSLFSDFGDSTKKRKRTIFDQDIDELASDGELGSRQGGLEGGAPDNNDAAVQLPSHMLPPPPTFFAGSSSSSTGRDGRIPPQVPSELAPDVIDLTTFPPTIEPTGAVAKKKVSKAKTSHRKEGDTIPMDEDKLDDDFDPTESAHKRKSKPKPKAKKGADTKGKGGAGRAQMEVSITSKPRKPKTNISTATAKTAEISAIAFISTLEIENTIISPDDKFDSGKPSSSSNWMNKKRKSIIESDLEDEDERGQDQQTAGTSSNKRKGRQGRNGENVDEETRSTLYIKLPAATKKAKKGKNVVWSDEDGEDSAIDADDSLVGHSKGKKPTSRIEDDADKDRSTKKQKTKGKRSQTKAKKTIEDASKDGNDAYMDDHENIQQLAQELTKENVIPPTPKTSKRDDTPKVENPGLFPSLHSRYEIAPRRSSLPMSELIRRANSTPGSPFATPHPRTSSSSMKSGTYSPYLKSSRSLLSRIAPLHPNRRTPPPPPPPPPPKKKTKKELEMEEKWEEEMIENMGGISEWTCLGDDEKKELRRAKWAREMGGWDD